MKRPSFLFTPVVLVLLLCGCNLPQSGTPGETNPEPVATQVALTMAAYTLAAQPVPISSPTMQQLSSPTLEQPTNTLSVPLSPTFTETITITPTITPTQAPSNTPVPKPGTIAGNISGYPYGSLGKLAIVAFGQESPYNYSFWITASGDTSYSMTSSYLIPGKYQVVAYDSSNNSGGCPGIVTVISEQTVTCNITDWGGGYPPKPSGVPNP